MNTSETNPASFGYFLKFFINGIKNNRYFSISRKTTLYYSINIIEILVVLFFTLKTMNEKSIWYESFFIVYHLHLCKNINYMLLSIMHSNRSAKSYSFLYLYFCFTKSTQVLLGSFGNSLFYSVNFIPIVILVYRLSVS